MRSLEMATEIIRETVEKEVGQREAVETFRDLGVSIEAVKLLQMPDIKTSAMVLQLGVAPYAADASQTEHELSQALVPVYSSTGIIVFSKPCFHVSLLCEFNKRTGIWG